MNVESRQLGFLLDPFVTVTDDQGKSVIEIDDAGSSRDIKTVLKVPHDGWYNLTIRDLHHGGGLRFAYRITLVLAQADVQLSIASQTFVVHEKKPLEIPVKVARLHGFDESFGIHCTNLPDGVKLECPTIKDQKEVKVKLTTSGNTEHSGPLRLVGRCPKTGISRVARIQVNGRKQLPWLTVIASD